LNREKLSRKKLNYFTSLHKRNKRFEHKCFLLEGTHLLDEALKHDYPLHNILYCPGSITKEAYKLIEKAGTKNIPISAIDSLSINRISTTKTPQPCVAVAPLPDINHRISGSALYFYKINDPGNLGTIMRTALWYGLNHVILSPESCDPFNTKTLRASQGAIFSINLTLDRDISTLASLQENFQVLLSDPQEINFPYIRGDFIAVFGSESQGLKDAVIDFRHQRFGIKRKGKGESLNLAVAAGIFLDRVLRA
jgi:TrmH family RNA methyltransferase